MMEIIDQRIAELEAADRAALEQQWEDGAQAPDRTELMWRLAEARELRARLEER